MDDKWMEMWSGPHSFFKELLEELMASENPQAYLIIEEDTYGGVVQLFSSKSEPLSLDIPLQILGREQVIRAKKLFAELGRPDPSETVLLDKPGGKLAGNYVSFTLELERDAEKGATLICRMFAEIYDADPEGEFIAGE